MIDYVAPAPISTSRAGLFSWLPFSGFISKKLGRVLVASLSRELNLAPELQDKLDKVTAKYPVDTQNGTVTTHDQATLDTVEITPPQNQDLPPEKKHFIVKFQGNGGFYEESLPRYVKDASIYNATVIAFNYRGVRKSQKAPVVFQDLVTDGIAEVQRLFDAGAKPQNILLDGESMGGGVATLVALHFHKTDRPVYLWNSRSFASLADTAVNTVAPRLPHAVKTCLNKLVSVLGWEGDAASAYEQIDKKYKAYMVVAKESKKHPVKSTGDKTIPHASSLHKAVRRQEKKNNTTTGYKVFANGIFKHGHKDKRKNLIYKENTQQTGQDLFGNFVGKVGL